MRHLTDSSDDPAFVRSNYSNSPFDMISEVYYGWKLSEWPKSENFDQSGILTHDLGMSSPLLYQLSSLIMYLVVVQSSLVFSVAAEIMESHCHCDLHSSLEALHT